MATLLPEYLDCVVFIGTPADGSFAATGFLCGVEFVIKGDVYSMVVLVTNRHVLEDLEQIVVRIDPVSRDSAKEVRVELRNPQPGWREAWTGHPVEKVDVAVAVLPVGTREWEKMGLRFITSDCSATRSQLRERGTSEGDFAFMLGFPHGMVGEYMNRPIVRGGVIARIRDMLQGESETFLVDAFSFGGNSGGPVVLKREPLAVRGTKSQSGHPVIGIVESCVSTCNETEEEAEEGEGENLGLTHVIPMDRVHETIRAHLSQLGVERFIEPP